MLPDDLDCVLQISRHLRGEYHPPSGVVFLVGEREHYVARGADVVAVIGAIDGVRSVDEIINACEADVSAPRALQILVGLQAKGFVSEVCAGTPEGLAFAAGLALPHSAPEVQLVDATESADGGARAAVAEALRGAGFTLSTGRGPKVIVVADYLAPTCLDQASEALQNGSACFLIKPGGLRPFIGPYFTGAPDKACPHCLLHCLREQRPVERLLQNHSAATRGSFAPRAALPASLAAAANLGALHLRRILAHSDPSQLGGKLWTLDFSRLELVPHSVRLRPQCAGCGDPGLVARIGERPVTLTPSPIEFSEDGGFRQESPATSYARLAHLVSPILGPVTHLHPMPGRHSEAHPVFSSGYLVMPEARAGTDPFDRRCAGKGSTVEQARMSALAEAIERYSGVYRGDEAVREATRQELGADAIHPSRLHLFSEEQQAKGGLAPPLLDDQTRIAWSPAWSLSENCRRYVPLAYCYAEAKAECGARFCRPSSNGSAAGNCLAEAILQGLFEAVERDAVAIWWYGRVRRPAALVSPAMAASFAAQCADREKLGWSLWTLDLTHDLGLPVVVAVAAHAPSDRFALGFGCHSDPDLALRRAVSECNQVLDLDAAVKSPWDHLAASQLVYLRPDPFATAVAPAPTIASRDLKVHVETWVSRLREHGLEVIVVDKTRPDLALNVAQVIVPGLRHAWPRFAPGRLYSVPVALKWGPHPLAEDQLNQEHLLI